MNAFADWKYIPILAISPAEMVALEQLPDKDKSSLLPLFPLKGWASAHRLESAIKRIKTSIDDRPWIADIDINYLMGNKVYLFTGRFPDTPVYKELSDLLDSSNGYHNWCEFISNEAMAIPCIRHESLDGLDTQISRLASLDRGVVFRISPSLANLEKHAIVLNSIARVGASDVLVIYDLGAIDENYHENIPRLQRFLLDAKEIVPDVALSISASSFPNGFARQERGENSIYERILYNNVASQGLHPTLIYSDRGSARAEKQAGGAGTPPPRIDYPLKKDWKFVRREVDDNLPDSRTRRKAAYIEIANEIVSADYWQPELRLWGTQQIELTAIGDEYAIYSPQRSTAARINIHLFVQLHYDAEPATINTDEEWVD